MYSVFMISRNFYIRKIKIVFIIFAQLITTNSLKNSNIGIVESLRSKLSDLFHL